MFVREAAPAGRPARGGRPRAQRAARHRDVPAGFGGILRLGVRRDPVEAGDTYVLCSDGVWGALEDDVIGSLYGREASAAEISASVVARAGAKPEWNDDVTVGIVVVR